MPKRIQARVPDDVYDTMLSWSKRLGVTMSQLGGMAMQAGIGSILRAVAPDEAISPELWAKIVLAMQAQGVDIPLPEGVKDELSSSGK